jgi:uncharacterized protein (DUF362 family)
VYVVKVGRRRFLKLGLVALAAGAISAWGLSQLGLKAPSLPPGVSRSGLKPRPLVGGKPVVAVVQGENPAELLVEALNLLGGLGSIMKPGDRVLIKPNYTWVGGARHPKGWRLKPQTSLEVEANTTDPRLVEGLVVAVQEAGGIPVVGEGSGGCETLDAFRLRGLDRVAERLGFELVDLNRDEVVRVENEDLGVFHRYWVPRTVHEADVLISVPCLKAWPLTGITVGLKNLIGTAPGERYGWPKNGLPHGNLPEPTIDRVIVDLAYINRINLVVVDGLWGVEGTWTKGIKPVKMDLLLAGFDPVATDAVAAAVMGFDPRRVRHLELARSKGLGTNRLEEVLVKGERLEAVARGFEPPEGLEHIVAGG